MHVCVSLSEGPFSVQYTKCSSVCLFPPSCLPLYLFPSPVTFTRAHPSTWHQPCVVRGKRFLDSFVCVCACVRVRWHPIYFDRRCSLLLSLSLCEHIKSAGFGDTHGTSTQQTFCSFVSVWAPLRFHGHHLNQGQTTIPNTHPRCPPIPYPTPPHPTPS